MCKYEPCYLCGNTQTTRNDLRGKDAYQYHCPICGDYIILGTLFHSEEIDIGIKKHLSLYVQTSNEEGQPIVELNSHNYKLNDPCRYGEKFMKKVSAKKPRLFE